jgi:hypothetical protein
LPLLRPPNLCNGYIVTGNEAEKNVRIAGEEGVLTDGEEREKGRWKMKERRGEIEESGRSNRRKG